MSLTRDQSPVRSQGTDTKDIDIDIHRKLQVVMDRRHKFESECKKLLHKDIMTPHRLAKRSNREGNLKSREQMSNGKIDANDKVSKHFKRDFLRKNVIEVDQKQNDHNSPAHINNSVSQDSV